MLYENFKLKILLALAPIKAITDKEDGMILIERMEDSIQLRFERFSYEVELIIKYMLAQMKSGQKIKY